MKRHVFPALLCLLALPLALTACGGGTGGGAASEPAAVQRVAGTDVYRITLSAEAAKRLGVRTAAVAESGGHAVIPYDALFYAAAGTTWAYVNTKPLTFEREQVVVDRIDGARVILTRGPAAGTKVATVGVEELHGIEAGASGSG